MLPNGTHFISKSCEGITESMLLEMGYLKVSTTKGRNIYTLTTENGSYLIDFEENIFLQTLGDREQLRMSLKSISGIGDLHNNYIDPIHTYIQTLKDAYADLQDKIGDLVTRLGKEYSAAGITLTQSKFSLLRKQVKLGRLEKELSELVDPLAKQAKDAEIFFIKAEISKLTSTNICNHQHLPPIK